MKNRGKDKLTAITSLTPRSKESYPFRGEARQLQLQPAVAFPNVIGRQRGYLHFPAVPQSERLIKPQQRGKEPRVSPATSRDYLYDLLPRNQFRIIRFVVKRYAVPRSREKDIGRTVAHPFKIPDSPISRTLLFLLLPSTSEIFKSVI